MGNRILKVLHIINSLGVGGAEKLLTLLIPEMRRQGVIADLLIIDRQRTIFHKQLEDKGVTEYEVLGCKSVYSVEVPVRLALFFRAHAREYDFYHAHLFPTQYWVPLAALASRFKGKLITTEHNANNRRRNIAFFKILDKYIYRRYATVTTVSSIATEHLRQYIASDKTRVVTIPNAIDLSVFDNAGKVDLSQLTGAPSDSFFAIQVSTFSAQKDHDTLIAAMAQTNYKLHLILVGKGERRQKMKALAHNCGVSDRVHFLGIRDDIPALLRSVDVAVLSSHYEGLSLSVIEALASGTPFIGTDSPGLGEITKDGGILVKQQDKQELASALDDLCCNRELRDQTSHRGLAVAKRYSIERIAGLYLQNYLQCQTE